VRRASTDRVEVSGPPGSQTQQQDLGHQGVEHDPRATLQFLVSDHLRVPASSSTYLRRCAGRIDAAAAGKPSLELNGLLAR
jgi:hypothetical protein